MKQKFEQSSLANGLTVVSSPMPVESVGVILAVRVGSRDESEKLNGISHFLEHMLFKGTEKWSKPTDMNKVIESVGGTVNAFTSREYTGYWVKMPKKYLSLGLEFLYQACFKPKIPKVELDKERGVIIEEIKMYEDNPMYKVRREYVALSYGNTCLGRHVLGPEENITRFKQSDFFDYLNRWYKASNMVLGVAGGGLDRIEEEVGKVFKQKSKSGEVSFLDKPEKVKIDQKEDRVKLVSRKIKQGHFCLGVRTFEKTNKDWYALRLINTVFGQNMSSRLFEEVREKRGLVYYVRSGLSSYLDTGDLMVQAGCDPKRLSEAIKVVRSEYAKLADKKLGINQEELRRAKEYAKGMMALHLEDSSQVAGMMCESLLLEGKVKKIEEVIKKIEAVTVEDVLRVAEKIVNQAAYTLTVVGPKMDNAVRRKLRTLLGS